MIELTLDQMMVVSGGANKGPSGGGQKGSGDGDTSCIVESLRDSIKGMDYNTVSGPGGGTLSGGTGGVKHTPICAY